MKRDDNDWETARRKSEVRSFATLFCTAAASAGAWVLGSRFPAEASLLPVFIPLAVLIAGTVWSMRALDGSWNLLIAGVLYLGFAMAGAGAYLGLQHGARDLEDRAVRSYPDVVRAMDAVLSSKSGEWNESRRYQRVAARALQPVTDAGWKLHQSTTPDDQSWELKAGHPSGTVLVASAKSGLQRVTCKGVTHGGWTCDSWGLKPPERR